MGIVNGTTNYILTRMTEAGAALRRRAGRGAEPGLRRTRPHRRRRGLRRRRQGRDHRLDRVRRSRRRRRRLPRGHQPASPPTTSRSPTRLGYVVKLLAIAEQVDDGAIAVRVHPAMVPAAHPLASVRDSFNAVFVEGDAVGYAHVLRPGRGRPADGERGARRPHRRRGATCARARTRRSARSAAARIRPIDETSAEYYLNARGRRPARRARTPSPGVFGAARRVDPHRWSRRGSATTPAWSFITHTAREADVQATLHELRDLDVVERGRQRSCASSATTRREVRLHPRARRRSLGFADVLLAGLAADGGPVRPRVVAARCADDRAGERPTRRRGRGHVAVRRRRDRPRRARSDGRRRVRDVRPPGRVPARRARRRTCGCSSCSTARRWRSRTSPCSSSAGCSTTSCAPGRAGHDRRSRPRATPVRRPSRRAVAAPTSTSFVLHPAGRVSARCSAAR